MKWAQFLHIYQPPYQKEQIVRKISTESYRKLFKGLLDAQDVTLTLNINGVLCDLLEKYGGQDILQDIKTLVERGTIELTGSAKFHAFLPLLPESEIEHQIRVNEETLTKHFGTNWKKGGFFPPEMAYTQKIAKVARKMGYSWIIIDEFGYPGLKKIDYTKAYEIESVPGMHVFFRERNLSFVVMAAEIGGVGSFMRYLDDRMNKPAYAVTAMDGEMFGHHRIGFETFLFDLLKEKSIEFTSFNSLIASYPKASVEPVDSTWAATRTDIKKGTVFARWFEPDNPIHKYQWEFTNLAITIAERSNEHTVGRALLDPALHSCQYWWASARPWWSIEMIERGAYGFKAMIEQSPDATPDEKLRAQELYQKIVYTSFDWQRSGYIDEIAHREDEEINERLEEKQKLFITKDEYTAMIAKLKEQIKIASAQEEFHQAAMMKERVAVLTEEMKKAKR